MSADALPVLPDPDLIISDAALIAASGTRAAQSGNELVTIWNGVQPHYQAPEQSLVYEAMKPVTVFTDEAQIVTLLIESALNTFAEAVRGMQARHRELVSAAGTSYPESTDDDPDYGKNKEAEVAAGISALAQEYAAAEEACAAAIRQADPAKLPDSPGFTDTPAWDIANDAADNVLTRIHQERVRVTVSSTVHVQTLDISRVFITYADGTVVPATRATLTTTVELRIQQHEYERTVLVANDELANMPPWAKRAGNALGALDIGLSIYDNVTEEWNQDLIDHPEYDTGERVASAAKNAAFETTGSVLGGAGGAWAGAAAGAAIGSVFPGPGTLIGGIVGGFVGGFFGGAAGEAAGSYAQDKTEGKSHEDSWNGAVKEFWGSLW
ncbi:hypothetical protein [Arthrobacter sp. zg-Y895]|uniref:hypothetical protein n=1 Tax=Arthrobacter sp. zg-Y895 TaxID=2886933 RepID=UPI001D1561EC|nr:hypothetical protein [Arthrobacter sp. zg-Y895]MCC3302026.1 hypothetical protein [Arthrobacter sp. zg-Y895]